MILRVFDTRCDDVIIKEINNFNYYTCDDKCIVEYYDKVEFEYSEIVIEDGDKVSVFDSGEMILNIEIDGPVIYISDKNI